MRIKVKKSKAKRSTLNAILGRMDRGEISVTQAYGEMQEFDKTRVSKLDRFLAVIAG
jgi:hypothetical protein